MFSVPPRELPAGRSRSAMDAFRFVLRLPAPEATHLHRYLYRLILLTCLARRLFAEWAQNRLTGLFDRIIRFSDFSVKALCPKTGDRMYRNISYRR